MSGSFKFYLLFLLFLTGCVSSNRSALESPMLGDRSERHETLHSVLWTQTAVEYAGITQGAYALAALQMEKALEDPTWTASLEQLSKGNYSDLPPAVVLDVDETVLDNSAYQARLIRDGAVYETVSWNEWVSEGKAGPIPGALSFTRYADALGVKVIYLTNRTSSTEEVTETNLKNLGFPLDPSEDTILTKAERPEWASSDKTSRRAHISETYRILLLIGDNFGDFSDAASGNLAERRKGQMDYQSYWGKKWIVLPNAMYGTWEAALYNYNYGLSESEKLRLKNDRLKTGR